MGRPTRRRDGRAQAVTLADLTPDPHNYRQHPDRNRALMREALRDVGAARSIVIDESNVILAGNGITAAALEHGLTKLRVVDADGDEVVAVRRTGLTDAQKRSLAVYDNRSAELAAWDVELLHADAEGGLIDLAAWFSDEELARLGIAGAEATAAGGAVSLADRFGVPPFSVLDARQGYWQDRKRAWLALGIESEIGRGDCTPGGGGPNSARNRPAGKVNEYGRTLRSNTTSSANAMEYAGGFDVSATGTSGTSIFDPVLCELAYRWFCPPNGVVLDPFAGGSVRGIVAAKLGRQYLGVDLRPEQVAANHAQAAAICADLQPAWIVGDSRALATLAADVSADLVFSCPPYGDLEVYSDDPADLSTMDYPAFLEAYRAIIAAAVARLKPDRFACFVVGDIRDSKGFYRGFVSDTAHAFAAAGAVLYNDAILVTALGSLPIRAGRSFETARKLGKTHQNVLVFCKGDPRRATAAVGRVEFGECDPLEP